MTKKIAVLPGDGIGPEVVNEAVKIIECLKSDFGLDVELEHGSVGGGAYDETGHPLPENTLSLIKAADAVLLGAVGGDKWDGLPREHRPETALLSMRAALSLFSNLRPAVLFDQLADASTLKTEVVSGLDIMIVRELTGGIYFGKPRGINTLEDGRRQGVNTLVYTDDEIERIAHSAFRIAQKRQGRLCSVDKANVLDCSQLWRDVVEEVAKNYPDVELSHMYVDNAAMQLVRAPKQFDVVVTSNMFGDILSDAASMLTGSIGMLPSASLDANGKGMYEPIHGTAPDIAGMNKANPLATVLSVGMMLRFTLNQPELADKVDAAVNMVLDQGLRTPDIASLDTTLVGTTEMGDALLAAIRG